MNCALCHEPIENYNSQFNHLKINDTLAADICGDCIDKFLRWQGEKYAKLFPTKAVKKRLEKNLE